MYASKVPQNDGRVPVGLAENTPKSDVFGCLDPDCGCAEYLAKCDAEARSGRIPTNARWWQGQQAFAIGQLDDRQVDRFFAEVAR